MFNCPSCGQLTIHLKAGSCGGLGSLDGCEFCDQVYIQTSGGVVDDGRHSYELLGTTLTKWRKLKADEEKREAELEKKRETGEIIKCPGCNLELSASDLPAQIKHMEDEHSEIIAERLYNSGEKIKAATFVKT